MPAQAHHVLLEHGHIQDPAEVGGCEKCLWVGQTDWAYRLEFDRPEQKGRTFLRCEGLDTFVDVYCNGRHLAFHDDCYLPLHVEITDELADTNHLLLHFRAARPFMEASPRYRKLRDEKGAFVRAPRKPAEDFGFFNGAKPSFESVGVHAPIYLEVLDEVAFTPPAPGADVTLSDDLTTGLVEIEARLVGSPGPVALRAVLTGPDGNVVAQEECSARIETPDAGALATKLTVADPQLWYPLNYGPQPLYELELTLLRDGKARDTWKRKIGFRKLEMVGDLDFRVNDLPVKLWGANFTPLPRPGHRWDDQAASRTLDWVENARMPSIRFWGPAQPANEQLLEEADRRGILVWMEFAHTGGPFPDDEEFFSHCRGEAENWVRAWKHHPSVLLWCGGNETYLGIDCAAPEQGRGDLDLFENQYREICNELDPHRPYVVNSPYGGGFGNAAEDGDIHVRDYDWFHPEADYPRLVTENIRITIPLRPTLEKHLGKDLMWPEGGFTGNRKAFEDPAIPQAWIDALCPNTHWVNSRVGYVGDFFEADGSVDSLLFRMGAGTARFIHKYIQQIRRGKEHWRADAPRRCMGYYWWKLNDTFPMIYASLIDDQLLPNFAYYAFRRAITPLLLSFEVGSQVRLWVVNDTGRAAVGSLSVKELDQRGQVVRNEVQADVIAQPGDSLIACDLRSFGQFYNKNPLLAELRDENGDLLARAMDYVTPDRNNWFFPAKLSARQEGDELVIETDVLARWVQIEGDNGLQWAPDDNFFDLIPGIEKRVKLIGPGRPGKITVRSHYNADPVELAWS
jgi:hypothetical protein